MVVSYICTNLFNMRNYRILTLISLLSIIALGSCVNADYDVEKINVDELAGLKGLTLPVGSTDRFTLKDFMTEDNSSDILKTDSEGFYYIGLENSFSIDPVTIPDFTIDPSQTQYTDNVAINTPVPIYEISKYPDFVTEPIPFPDVCFGIEISETGIPTEVKNLEFLYTDGYLDVAFSYDQAELPFSGIWLAKGTSITIPACIKLGDLPEGFALNEGGNLLLVNDLLLESSGAVMSFPISSVDLTKLPEGQGMISAGHLLIKQDVLVSGKVFFRAADCTAEGVYYPEFDLSLSISELDVKYVLASVDMGDLSSIQERVNIAELPDILKGDDICLDINGLRVDLDLRNTFTVGGTAQAEIQTFRNGSDKSLASVTINDLEIPNFGNKSYSFTEENVPGLNSLFSVIPDYFIIDVSADIDDQMLIAPGSTYTLDMDYSIHAPLSFGKDFRFTYQNDIKDLNVSVEGLSLSKAVLACDIVTTLPFTLNASALPIDAEGNVIEDITVETKGYINGGSMDSPSVSRIEIVLSNKGDLYFDGVRLNLSASSVQENAALNENQYIQLDNISLSLPEGVGYIMQN